MSTPSGLFAPDGSPLQITVAAAVAAILAQGIEFSHDATIIVSNFPANQPVSGTGAVGGAPVNAPLSISGIDNSGNKQHVLLDATGRQQVYWGAGIATNQVTVGTGQTLIVPARVGRRSVTIVQEGTTLVRMGATGVTLGNGIPLPGVQYASFDIQGGAAVYGIAATAQLVSFVENF